MDTYLVSLILSFVVSVALTPLMIALAKRSGTFDKAEASHRKIHAGDIPRLGGVAIVAGFYAPVVGLAFYSTKVGDSMLANPTLARGLLGGGLLIAALGLFDDLKGASPKLKLAVQLAAALWVGSLGFLIDRIDLPFLPMMQLGWLAWPLTIVWIVGVTNAVNLIDGLDGLAAGMALFGLMPMLVLSIAKGNVLLALLCCCLAGSILGFLLFNFHPARIFMGDTGSMFLGFVLAVVTVETSHKGRVAVAMLMPVLALGLPILDTLLAIARRAWFGQNLFVGDKQHIHHRLLDSGYSHRNTVLVMYGFAGLFALGAVGVGFNRDWTDQLLFVLSLLVAGALLRKVGYLAFPTQLGADVAYAGLIRERNQLVRATLSAHEDHLAVHLRSEALALAAGDLAHCAGAASADLVLHPDGPGDAGRSWAWTYSPVVPQPDDPGAVAHSFPILDKMGRVRGSLSVRWTSDTGFHEAVVPVLERGVGRLGGYFTEVDATPVPMPTAHAG